MLYRVVDEKAKPLSLLEQSIGEAMQNGFIYRVVILPEANALKRINYFLSVCKLILFLFVYASYKGTFRTQSNIYDWTFLQIADELFECVWPFCEVGA